MSDAYPEALQPEVHSGSTLPRLRLGRVQTDSSDRRKREWTAGDLHLKTGGFLRSQEILRISEQVGALRHKGVTAGE